MEFPSLTQDQISLLNLPDQHRVFLEGKAGSGKTTASVARVLQMIERGIPAETILLLVPQRSLALPYYQAFQQPEMPVGGSTDVLTLGGLGQRMIALFWPMIAEELGFVHPDRPPSFLTLETAQYVMAQIVHPLVASHGYFSTLNIDPNRLLSQIIDNLNKAAAIGVDHRSTSGMLSAAWIGGQEAQASVFEQAQDCANRFRDYCYQNNLLDFSLQMEIFTRHLWHSDICRDYLQSQYRHLIYENIEEDVPVAHDLIRSWLPEFESALLIYDDEAGYRLFLGADAASAYSLKEECDRQLRFEVSLVNDLPLELFENELHASIQAPQAVPAPASLRDVFEITHFRFQPQMAADTCRRVANLVEEGVPPEEIVILAPFLSDSLRFSLSQELSALGLQSYTNRPSRSLGNEPVTHCLLTFAKLVHPRWEMSPSHFHLRYALMQAIESLDLVRADLLTHIVYHENKPPEERLSSFYAINAAMQDRIRHQFGGRFEQLREWLLGELNAEEPQELDVFLSRLFGEVLSQPGFGFHHDYEAAAITSRLIESVQKFRRGTSWLFESSALDTGAEYIRMVEQGVIAAQYLQSWEPQPENTILLAPAYTFLMANRPAAYQFWLDVGSSGWWQRLFQPLTHPVVLSRHWEHGRTWTDIDEQNHNRETLTKLTTGLLRRCSQKIYLCAAEMDQQGYETKGLLLQALQNLIRRIEEQEVENDV
ncbi:MAG: DEAD/DEAH box helicase family protein [Anaerolineaceae bacterium]|nr:DEAD/DEAH box helicase family protein [Anaerolineaceae bacterium]